ncbi:heme o synthase [Staphylospora marina]|uniref:heme o synthase n=1 Tax=Staphylospora marina TaxID=2490858 RepID=UPI000F5BD4C1|nr:heme o synthase [Staphylospora marina]
MQRSIPRQDAGNRFMPDEVTAKTGPSWRDFVEITKPGINKSNLLAAFAGYWMAAGLTELDVPVLLWTLLGTALVIAGGCTLNNLYDRDIDPLMERTRDRTLVRGTIRPSVALWYGIVLTVTGLTVLALGANPLAALLGFMGFFVYVVVYTMWLKRTSVHNTLVGSFSGAVPPVIGWVAAEGTLGPEAWALFLILFFWQPPHFFALAMRRVDDYRAAGIPMLPVVRGFQATKKQTLAYTILLFVSSLFLWWTGACGWIYLVAAVILGGLYVRLVLKGFRTGNDVEWANRLFFYSLIYLTVLFTVIIVDVTVRELL